MAGTPSTWAQSPPAPPGPSHPPHVPQAAKPAPKPPHAAVHPPAPAPHRPAAPTPAPAPPPTPEHPPEPAKGTNTGMPLPRFAALRSDEVNLRSGPGTRYPIEWVYKRRDLPVEIEREFEVWRLVRDQEGTKGWVHQATLTGRRTVIVTGAARMLRREPKDSAAAVAHVKPGVIARLRFCDPASEWCEAQVQDYRGWLKRSDVWGIAAREAVP